MVGAVFGWPDGVWAATDRTPQSEPAMTFVERDLKHFHSLQGPPATGLPFTQVRKLAGQGSALWAATDRGLARIATADGRVDLLDEARGLPDGVVYAVVSRQGRLTVGTRRGARPGERLAPRGAAGSAIRRSGARGVPDRRLGLGGHPARVAAGPAGPARMWSGRPRSRAASFQVPVIALGRARRYRGGAHAGPAPLARSPAPQSWTLGPNLSGLLGGLVAFAPDGPGFWVAGDRGVAFARLSVTADPAASGGDLPGDSNDLAVDAEYLWVATNGGLVRFRLDAIRP